MTLAYLQVNVLWAGAPAWSPFSPLSRLTEPDVFVFHAPGELDEIKLDQTDPHASNWFNYHQGLNPDMAMDHLRQVVDLSQISNMTIRHRLSMLLSGRSLVDLNAGDLLGANWMQLAPADFAKLRRAIGHLAEHVHVSIDDDGHVYLSLNNTKIGATITLGIGSMPQLEIQFKDRSGEEPAAPGGIDKQSPPVQESKERQLSGQWVNLAGQTVRLQYDGNSKHLVAVDSSGRKITEHVFTSNIQDLSHRTTQMNFAIDHIEVAPNGQLIAKGLGTVAEGQAFKDGNINEAAGSGVNDRPDLKSPHSSNLDVRVDAASGQVTFRGKEGGGGSSFRGGRRTPGAGGVGQR